MKNDLFNTIFLALVILASGDAYSDSTIYACAHKNSGDLRVISAPGQCLPSEYEVSWSSGDQSQQRINELLGRVAAIEAALGVINEAPVVSAGQDETILLSMTFSPIATATDDGLVRPLSFLWEKVSGIGAVNFTAATNLTTSISVSDTGIYVVRLSVSDGAVTVSDELQLTVYPDNTPPTITTPQSPLIVPAKLTNFSGTWVMSCEDIHLGTTATDDGLPLPLSFNWQHSSPRPVSGGLFSEYTMAASFSLEDSSSPDWPLNISARTRTPHGSPFPYLPYAIEVTALMAASDGYYSTEGALIVQCDARASETPQVYAGPSLTQTGIASDPFGSYNCHFNIDGSAVDDGLPLPLEIEWSRSGANPGPGSWNYTYAAGFGNVNSPQTTFSVNVRGSSYFLSPNQVEFLLTLTARDGYRSATDQTNAICVKPSQ